MPCFLSWDWDDYETTCLENVNSNENFEMDINEGQYNERQDKTECTNMMLEMTFIQDNMRKNPMKWFRILDMCSGDEQVRQEVRIIVSRTGGRPKEKTWMEQLKRFDQGLKYHFDTNILV